MPLTWTGTDLATRIWFYLHLGAVVVGGALVVWADFSIALAVLVALLLFQTWRLANEKLVTVTIDGTGVTKTLGRDTWHRDWSDVSGARLRRVLGSHQLVLAGAASTPQEWSFSIKLFCLARIGRGALAVQVQARHVESVRSLLAEQGWH
jgi:hypothetical protein